MHTARTKLAALLAAAAVILTGCLSVDQDVTVDQDGSGTFVVELRLSPELVAVFSTFGDEELTSESLVSEFENDTAGDFPEGTDVTVTPLDSGEGVGARIELAFDNLDQLNQLLTPDPGADASSAFTGEVTRNGDRFEFRAQAVPEEELAGDFGFGSEGLGSNLPEPEARLSLKLPGGVVETNGTQEDGVVTWDLLADDLPQELVLVTDLSVASGGGLPWLLILGVVLLLVAVGAGVGFVLLRRRDPRPPAVEYTQQANWPGPGPVPPGSPYPGGPVPPQAPAAADPNAWAPQAPAAPVTPQEPTPQVHEPEAPVPADAELPPAGWYPDPQDPTRSRWWTGRQWSD